MGLTKKFGRRKCIRAGLIGCCIVAMAFLSFSAHSDLLDKSVAQQEEAAKRMFQTSQGLLAPVYAPLAQQIVNDLDLEKCEGIGIDLGSGPGCLILELCKRTRLHWINADINPCFFAEFFSQSKKYGVDGRVSAIQADATNLPFKDNYADIVVSRGSYPFWGDQEAGFREVWRVLKPGGSAYIGRGFSRNLPLEIARKIRAKQGDKMKYDPQVRVQQLKAIMESIGIKHYTIETPTPKDVHDIHYGLWVRFQKPRKDIS